MPDKMSSAFRFQDIFVRGVQDPYPFYHSSALAIPKCAISMPRARSLAGRAQ